MAFRRFVPWSLRLYNEHFERPLHASLPFILVTILFLLTLGREIWVLAVHGAAIAAGDRFLFLGIVLMTPLMWVKGLLQHHRYRAIARRLSEPAHGGLLVRGAIAEDYLYTATIGYLLLSLLLSFVPR